MSVPLAFEGRPDGQLISRQGPYEVTLAAGRITLNVADAAGRRGAVTSTLLGADPDVRPEGTEQLAGRANYIVGNDQAQWRTGIPLFGRAIYRGLYPGVDLVFHGTARAMEYDFVVKPGASARPIAFEISGASALRLEADGTLAMATPAGEIRWHKPEVYQTADGVRREVAGRFVRHGSRVTFALGSYDHSRTLIIDPTVAVTTLGYASYFGGSSDDAARGVAVDASGNFYITGFSSSNNLPVTKGAFQTAYHGGTAGPEASGDAFVAKFTAAGALAYVTYIGGSMNDVGSAIAVDSGGNAYVTGQTDSADFPTVAGSLQTVYQGAGCACFFWPAGDAFALKLNAAGNGLVYSTYLGGSQDDRGTAIAVDSAGDAYIGGTTLSTNFPAKNAYQANFKGGGGSPAFCCGNPDPYLSFGDGFIAKLNPGGTSLVFSTYFGGSLDDTVTSLAVDSSGNVYFGGSTLSADLPVLNAIQSHFGGSASPSVQPFTLIGDGYVAELSSAGSLLFSTYLGGSSDDAVMALAIDNAGGVYVTGFTSSTNFPVTANAAQHSYGGGGQIDGFLVGDAFAAKLSPATSTLVYSTYLGGSQDDAGMAIAVSSGYAYVGGFTNSSTNFPITTQTAVQAKFGGASSSSQPTGDGFLSQISPDGGTILYSTYYGGLLDDAVGAIAVDAQGSVYLTGSTTSTNLPTTANAAQRAFGGIALYQEDLGDAFVAIISGITAVVLPGQTITFGPLNDVSAGAAPFTITATASSGLTVSFASTTPSVCTVAGTTVTIVATGTCSITASQAGSSTFAAATTVTESFTVHPAGSNGPAITPGSIGPVYSSSTTIQPGSWISIYGTNLASAPATWNGDFPTMLGGVTVTINGENAYLWYVGPTQINLQAPDDATTGVVPVTVTNSNGSWTSTVTLGPISPSFSVLDGKFAAGIILRPDGTGAYGNGQYDIIGPTGTSFGYATVAAKAGDAVELFGVGFGPTSPHVPAGQLFSGAAATTNPVQVTIGGTPVTPSFAGMTSAGLYQINLTTPAGAGTGNVPIVATVGGLQTQSFVLISLQ